MINSSDIQPARKYDFGRKLKDTDPLNKTWTWRYDRFGNPTTAIDPKAQTIQMTWTYGHQLQTRTIKNANSVLTSHVYRYDPLGRRDRHTDSSGSLGTQYQQSGKPFQYLYDKTDNIRNAVTSQGGSFGGKVIEYGNARVGVGEVFDAFYGSLVNRSLAGYQGLQAFGASTPSVGAPYSGSNSGGIRPGK